MYQVIHFLSEFNIFIPSKHLSVQKLTMMTSEWFQWRRFEVFIINFEYISLICLVLLLLTWNRSMLAGMVFLK